MVKIGVHLRKLSQN